MAKLLLERYLADILRLAEAARWKADSPHWLETYAHLHRIDSIVGRALQEAEFELEQAEREKSG